MRKLGWYVCAQSLSYVWLFSAPWTVDCHTPVSEEFSRQEYWNGLPFPPPADLLDPGIETMSLASPALAGRFFTIASPRNPQDGITTSYFLFTLHLRIVWHFSKKELNTHSFPNKKMKQYIGLAKKFIWIFQEHHMEKPKQTFLANPIFSFPSLVLEMGSS